MGASRIIQSMSKLHLTLKDEEYPYSGFSHTRLVARAFVMDEKGNYALHTVSRDDAFGCQTYFETPGGGVEKGETLEIALVRECKEELGEEVEILEELGSVDDAYNLIKRANHNVYFLCRKLSTGKKHFVSKGDGFIKKTERLPINEIVARYQAQDDHGVAGLVKRRELPFALLLSERNAK